MTQKWRGANSTPSTRRPAFRPALEALEARWLPSAGTRHLALEGHHHGSHVAGHARHHAGPIIIVVEGIPGLAGVQGLPGIQGPAGSLGTAIPFSLAAGATSAPIAVPADRPVFVIANTTTPGDQGTGFISLEYSPLNGGLLEWNGLNSALGSASGGNVTVGHSSSAGTVASNGGASMLFFGFNGAPYLEVIDPGHFVIYNPGGPATGTVWLLAAPM